MHPSVHHSNAIAFTPPRFVRDVDSDGIPYTWLVGYVLPTGDLLPPTEGGFKPNGLIWEADELRADGAEMWEHVRFRRAIADVAEHGTDALPAPYDWSDEVPGSFPHCGVKSDADGAACHLPEGHDGEHRQIPKYITDAMVQRYDIESDRE